MLKSLKHIDHFYFALGAVLTVLAIVVIIMLRTIFFAFQTASTVEDSGDENTIPRIDKAELDEVYGKLYSRTPPQLDL